jgi:hypothetical protein
VVFADPLVVPFRAGAVSVSCAGIDIVRLLDQEETSVGWEMHRARAFTVYVPPVLQECDAEVLVLHVEDVPSPQSKLYSRVWPKFELAPLTQYP